jgi:hypothetical protein
MSSTSMFRCRDFRFTPKRRSDRLLRTRRERPHGRAAEQRDELAPSQLVELSLRPAGRLADHWL